MSKLRFLFIASFVDFRLWLLKINLNFFWITKRSRNRGVIEISLAIGFVEWFFVRIAKLLMNDEDWKLVIRDDDLRFGELFNILLYEKSFAQIFVFND